MKTCSKCKIEYPVTVEYFKLDKRKKLGLSSWCKKCAYIATKQYIKKNREKHNKLQNELNKKWAKNNLDKIKIKNKNWREKNKEQLRINSNIYNKRLKQVTPKNKEIRNQLKEIYRNCPRGYTVDHIIPIQGKNISGFSVPKNLQYLTPQENSSKGNKFKPYIESLRG